MNNHLQVYRPVAYQSILRSPKARKVLGWDGEVFKPHIWQEDGRWKVLNLVERSYITLNTDNLGEAIHTVKLLNQLANISQYASRVSPVPWWFKSIVVPAAVTALIYFVVSN